jgi:Cu-Zn family superoxide dismutase
MHLTLRLAVLAIVGLTCSACHKDTGPTTRMSKQPGAMRSEEQDMPGPRAGGDMKHDMMKHDMSGMKMAEMGEVKNAVAVIHPLGDNKVMGTVKFMQMGDKVHIIADLTGLTPGKHGFHIHEFGDCSDPKGASAGGHFNPEGHQHGAPDAESHHAGDLGNITADESGKAHLEVKVDFISISGKNAILGRGVIVHEKEDDLKEPKTGNAGGRIGCGVIGIAKD